MLSLPADQPLYLYFFALLALSIAITFTIIEIKQYLEHKKLGQNGLFGEPPLTDAQAKGYEIIHNAIKQSQEILSNAELQGIKTVADTRLHTDRLSSDYDRQFQIMVSRIENQFATQAQQAEKEFIAYMADLKTRSEQTQSMIDSIIRDKFTALFGTLEQNLSSVMTQTIQHTLATIQQQLEDSRMAVDTYQKKQLDLIDQNIIDLLEKTLSVVLIKKLSLKDQLDLVYEALEKAKIEKFLDEPTK